MAETDGRIQVLRGYCLPSELVPCMRLGTFGHQAARSVPEVPGYRRLGAVIWKALHLAPSPRSPELRDMRANRARTSRNRLRPALPDISEHGHKNPKHIRDAGSQRTRHPRPTATEQLNPRPAEERPIFVVT